MAAQQFKVRNGLLSSGNITFESVSSGSQATNGKILVLDAGSNVVYRTSNELRGDIGALANSNMAVGDGLSITFNDPSSGDVKYSLGTPSTLNVSTSSATTTSSHTHAITTVSDASGISTATILAANSSGGVKVATFITSSDATVGGDLDVTGSVAISGNLQVDGTLTYVNTTNLSISDPLITLSDGLGSGDTSTNDQGLLINRGDQSNVAFIWDESLDQFALVTSNSSGQTAGNVEVSDYADIHVGGGIFEDNVSVGGNVGVTSTTSSTNTSTGSITTGGGIGVGENVYVGANVVVQGTTDASNTTTGSIQTAGGIGVAKSLYVGQSATIVGQTIEGVNQESTTLANTVTISDNSNTHLFQVALTSFTGAEVTLKIKAGTNENQVRKLLISENGSGAVDYTEYGSVGHPIAVELLPETTDGSGLDTGTTHMALRATNTDGGSVEIRFVAMLMKN